MIAVFFFISIAIGIWALAMTQVFKPSNAIANYHNIPYGRDSDPCEVKVVAYSDAAFKAQLAKITWLELIAERLR